MMSLWFVGSSGFGSSSACFEQENDKSEMIISQVAVGMQNFSLMKIRRRRGKNIENRYGIVLMAGWFRESSIFVVSIQI